MVQERIILAIAAALAVFAAAWLHTSAKEPKMTSDRLPGPQFDGPVEKATFGAG